MFKVEIKVDLKDVERLTREYPVVSQQVREAKITEALALLERMVRDETPVGAGPIHLRDTIHPTVGVTGEKVWGILGTPAVYGESVEFGTKPHFPPVGPLVHWVERKLGIQGKEAQSVAFLIARAISKRGTKGAAMFGKGFEQAEAAVTRILMEIPEEIVRRVEAGA
jgi:hypothetical protein